MFGFVSFILSIVGLFIGGLPLGCLGIVLGIISLCQLVFTICEKDINDAEEEVELYNQPEIKINKQDCVYAVIGIIISVIDILAVSLSAIFRG